MTRTKPLYLIAVVAVIAAGCTPTPSPTALFDVTPPATMPGLAAAEPAPDGLGLTGTMIWSSYDKGVFQMDVATREIRRVFEAPQHSLITAVALSPDGSQFALAYAPPPKDGATRFGYTQIYMMPASGPAEPTLFHSGATIEESYTTPFWSADGAMLYFGHSTFEPSTGAYSYWLERMDLQSGEITQVAENAFFPRLVSDGSKLIYLRMVPVTSIGDVVLSDPDGSNLQVLIKSDLFQAVDAPILTPDGSQIVFSAVGEPLTQTPVAQPRDWFAELFGVRSAKAHVTPSDLWIMPIEGGTPERLTALGEIGIVPVFSPDGGALAFIGTAGVYVMRIGEWGPYLLAPAAANGSLVWR